MDKRAEDYLDGPSGNDDKKNTPTDKQERIARAIVELVSSVKSRQLGRPESIELWNRIQERSWRKARQRTIRRKIGLWSAAASVIAAAGLFYYRYDSNDTELMALASRVPTTKLTQGGPPSLAIGADTAILLSNLSSVRFHDGTLEITDEHGAKIQHATTRSGEHTSVQVPYGQRTSVELPDGTQVTLNAGSVLIFPSAFAADKREVSLRGEGFFKVAHGKERPFYVYTENVRIKVLGTSFNLSAYPDDDESGTYLVEGRVELTPMGKARFEPQILEKGNLATFDRRHGRLALTTHGIESHISWTQKRLDVRSVPLSNIIRKLERHYNLEIELKTNGVEDERFSGTLDLQRPVQAVLRDILHAESSTIKQKGRRITVESK